MPERFLIGAMSGTSADGVDVALVAVSGHGVLLSARIVSHSHHAYEPRLKTKIFSTRSTSAIGLPELADLARRISQAYAQAVNESMRTAHVASHQIAAIAAHGQTLYHAPPNTIQWLDPALLAAETGCAVISDFRRADCAAGGQGAPLVPFADYLLFRDLLRGRVLLNLGGIANLTFLSAGCGIDDVIAFDTGPGNCISDFLCRQYHPDSPGYDPGGQRAASEKPETTLVEACLRHPYFTRRPPKSTDGPEMIDAFLNARAETRLNQISPGRQLATACFIASRAILDGIRNFCRPIPADLIMSGGGTENRTLMGFIHQMAADAGIETACTTDEFKIPSAAKEAIAFALLGAATLDGFPSNIPGATGARARVVLGSITPAPAGAPRA